MAHRLCTRPGTLAIVLLLGTPSVLAAAQEARPQPDVIVTSGEAVIKATPDRAVVTVSVESRAKLPKDAQQQNATVMTAVQNRLRADGIAADAIRTVAVELSPEFDYTNGRQQLRGYVARNSVEIRVDSLDRLGDVIDASVAAGATNITGVQFDVKRRDELERDALRQAVVQARSRADALAASAGRTIERIVRIEDGGAAAPPPPRPYYMARTAAAEASTPISPGELEIRAHINLTLALK
jgi:uncharacterized protein YggE